MPNKDGKGPEGKGPKTGRQVGKCEGAEPTGRGMGGKGVGRCGHERGKGLGRGQRGRGRGHNHHHHEH